MNAADTCFHCDETLPGAAPNARIDGVDRRFCCEGCAAAAVWIDDARLGQYYRLRDGRGQRAATGLDLALWDREELLAEHAHPVEGGREISVLTDAMRCSACAWLVDRALSREPGVLSATANAVTGRIRIAWDPQRTRLSTVLERLAALGFPPYLATGAERERARRRERRQRLLRWGIAGLGAMQAMMFAEALYLDPAGDMSLATRDFLRWITFLLSTPVVFYGGWPFLHGALNELRHRRLGMDTLVSASMLLAWGASVAETLRGGTHVWYDAAVMFVFLLLTARMLEERARSAANAHVDALARARPAFVVRETDDDLRETVPLSMLATGDIVHVPAGQVIPADGALLDHHVDVEESLLTGESLPVRKHVGTTVLAGSVCRERPARLQVTAIGPGTRLAQITRLVEAAQAHRPPLAQLSDRIAGGFVAAMALVAVAVHAWWRMHDPERAFEVTLALLVVTCPCALSLAMPAAYAAAQGALAKLGVLALRADALDRLARVSDVVFDKTGTLTDGSPELGAMQTFLGMPRDRALAMAAALERGARHPLASLFEAHHDPALQAHALNVHAGQGVEGEVGGCRWRIGQAGFVTGGSDDGAIWLGNGDVALARFEAVEALRPDAPAATGTLRGLGLELHLASGDAEARVGRVAKRLGIDDWDARLGPEDKLRRIRALQSAGRTVAMVGDGINDAPVLGGADLAIAMGSGADLAHRSADLVLAVPRLQRIADAVRLAHRTRRIVRQNIVWAVGYNLLAIPAAAAGLVTPWLAALGMAASSLLVTLNALRLCRPRSGDAGVAAKPRHDAPATLAATR